MAVTKDVIIKLIADIKQFQTGMGSVAKSLKKTGDNFTNFGRGAAIRFAALGAGIVGLTKTFANLEKGIANTLTLLDTPQVAQFGETIKTQVNSAVANMGFAIGDVNKAMFDTVSALGANQRAFNTFATAQRLAVGGVADLSVTTKGLTSVINAYGRETTKANDVAVAFFTAQKYGQVTVSELSSNIGKAAPIAKQLGISYQELLAAMSQLTLGGLSAELATTALRSTMVALYKPAAGAEKVLKKLGVPVGAVEIKAVGLVETLRRLNAAAKANPEAMGEMIPNIRALTGAGALGEKELNNLAMIIESIREETLKSADGLDVLTKAVKKQQATADFAFKRMAGSLTIASAAIGEALAPALISLSKLIVKFAQYITNLSPKTKKWIANILLTVTALTGLVAVVALTGGALLKSIAIIINMTQALKVLGTVLKLVFTTPAIFAFLVTLTAIITATKYLIKNWDIIHNKFATSTKTTKQLNEELAKTNKEITRLGNKGPVAIRAGIVFTDKAKSEQLALLEERKAAIEAALSGTAEEGMTSPEESPEVLRQQAIDQKLAVMQATTDAAKAAAKKKLQATLAKIELEGQKKADKFEQEQVKKRMLFLGANNKAELEQREQTLTDLAAMTQSKNQTLAAIGKAAAIHQVIISTQAAMARAIEFLGPFGIPAAIALAAFGAERISTINAAGLATGSTGLDEDMIAQFSKNEIVIPETFAEGIRGGELALVGAGAGDANTGTQIVNNFDFTGATLGSPSDDFITAIEDSIFERGLLDIGGIA